MADTKKDKEDQDKTPSQLATEKADAERERLKTDALEQQLTPAEQKARDESAKERGEERERVREEAKEMPDVASEEAMVEKERWVPEPEPLPETKYASKSEPRAERTDDHRGSIQTVKEPAGPNDPSPPVEHK